MVKTDYNNKSEYLSNFWFAQKKRVWDKNLGTGSNLEGGLGGRSEGVIRVNKKRGQGNKYMSEVTWLASEVLSTGISDLYIHLQRYPSAIKRLEHFFLQIYSCFGWELLPGHWAANPSFLNQCRFIELSQHLKRFWGRMQKNSLQVGIWANTELPWQ